MKNIVIFIAVVGVYLLFFRDENQGFTGEHHNKVVMYSLSFCQTCKDRKKELDKAGIEYKEYYIDKDSFLSQILGRF